MNRYRQRQSYPDQLIVPLVGAGASKSAGLPTASELKGALHKELYSEAKKKGGEDFLEEILKRDANHLFGQKVRDGIPGDLTLFEFASVVSQTKWGRDEMPNIVRDELERARCSQEPEQVSYRPLAYELLAHLAKHEFIDHFISLNFDELLDGALEDEIPPDQLYIIGSSDDLPGPGFIRENLSQQSSDKLDQRPIFLFKPFGSLSRDLYRLTPEETKRYGSESIWGFMVEQAFQAFTEEGGRPPDVCLLVVGYACEEDAFGDFLGELCRKEHKRKVRLFVIDPKDKNQLSRSLKGLDDKDLDEDNIEMHHIQLHADLAFDLLLQILKEKYREDHYTWIPVDRHKVISYCLDYCLDLESPETGKRPQAETDRRFEVELILQAVKSRGFFNTEAIENIRRIRQYHHNASEVIEQMRGKVIKHTPRKPYESAEPFRYFHDNYQLILNDEDLANYVLKRVSNRDPEKDEIPEWIVERNSSSKSGWKVESNPICYRKFLAKRFKEIAAAPEIEVVNVSPATRWHFRAPMPLRSVAELTACTADLLEANLFKVDFTDDAEAQMELYGIWATGEWLFHKEGWAWPGIGKRLVEDLIPRGKLKVNLVLAKTLSTDETRTERAARAEEVRERLEGFGEERCEPYWINWWDHNRTLTLLCWSTKGAPREGGIGGIYMRRRQRTPLVAPVYVHHEEDCRVLGDVFEFYRQIAKGPEAER